MQETPKPYSTRKQNNLARPPVNLHIDDTEDTSDAGKTSGFKVTLNARDQRANQTPSDEQDATASTAAPQNRHEGDLLESSSTSPSTDTRETADILEWTDSDVAKEDIPLPDEYRRSQSSDAPDSVWMTDARDAADAEHTARDDQQTPLPLEARAYNETPDAAEPQAFVDTSYAARTASDTPTMSGLLTTPLLSIITAVAVLAAAWSYSSLEGTRAQLTAATEAKAAVDRALADAQGRLTAAENALAGVKAALTSSPAAVKKAPAPVAPAKAAP